MRNVRKYYSRLFLLITLVKDIFKSKQLGTQLGIAWLLLPIFTQLVIYYLIFSIGLKVPMISNVPFIFYFFPLFIIWSYIAETISSSSTILSEYNFLITKISFPFYLLPIAVSITNLITYLLILFPVLIFIRIRLSLGFIDIFNTLISLILIFIFTTTLSCILSLFASLSNDLKRIIPIALNSLFWLTPMVYPESLIYNLPSSFSKIIIDIYPINILLLNFRACALSSFSELTKCNLLIFNFYPSFLFILLIIFASYSYIKLRYIIMENIS
tara:strand:- start:4262 stop:5074 length:813 start_codon:yes stop_codon:yes gene_type:complete